MNYANLSGVHQVFVDAINSAWGLPTPVDVLAIVLLVVLWLPTIVVVRATQNVASLGPWFPPVYWLIVAAGVWLGCAGATGTSAVFSHGEDLPSLEQRRTSVLGWSRKVIRWQVRTKAQVSAGAVIVGWGGATALVAIGVFWTWLVFGGSLYVLRIVHRGTRRKWWLETPT